MRRVECGWKFTGILINWCDKEEKIMINERPEKKESIQEVWISEELSRLNEIVKKKYKYVGWKWMNECW